MVNQHYIQEDEIDLRKYIDIIIRRKRLILSFFVIALIAAITTVSLSPKVYKATASVTITPAQETLLTSNDVLQRVIKKLNLTESTEVLAQKISFKKMAGTNGVLLSVVDAKPQAAQEIANAWAEDVTSPLARVSQGAPSADLDIEKALLNSYKSEFTGMALAIKSKEALLVELKKQIATQEKIIVLSQAVSDDASGARVKNLKTEVINPLYQDLNVRIVNTEIEINTQKLRMQDLRKAIGPMTKEIQVEESKIVSSASAPIRPEGQSKVKIVVLVGILSLMFGTLVAFFVEFWKWGEHS